MSEILREINPNSWSYRMYMRRMILTKQDAPKTISSCRLRSGAAMYPFTWSYKTCILGEPVAWWGLVCTFMAIIMGACWWVAIHYMSPPMAMLAPVAYFVIGAILGKLVWNGMSGETALAHIVCLGWIVIIPIILMLVPVVLLIDLAKKFLNLFTFRCATLVLPEQD